MFLINKRKESLLDLKPILEFKMTYAYGFRTICKYVHCTFRLNYIQHFMLMGYHDRFLYIYTIYMHIYLHTRSYRWFFFWKTHRFIVLHTTALFFINLSDNSNQTVHCATATKFGLSFWRISQNNFSSLNILKQYTMQQNQNRVVFSLLYYSSSLYDPWLLCWWEENGDIKK